ncbi:MAG: heme exporter protein CcmD [Rhodospirillaceae bacterium]|nr:MAG: heme exporter protein CcmD [Rhodospirillaceae bacterium]
MEGVSTFLAMGGYAAYVWPAYGVAAIILIAFAIDSWRRVRVAAADLRRMEASNTATKSGPAMRSRSAAPKPTQAATPATGSSDEFAGS